MKSRKTHNEKQYTEDDLLLRYKASGDLYYLGKLYEPYMPLIYGLCMKYLKDEAKSEDAVMQIFEELIPKLKVHQVNHFKSWLYTLAKNFCLMQLRLANKTNLVQIDDFSVENDLFEHLTHEHESSTKERALQLMEKCLNELNNEQRVCIRLFYLEQRCYQQVSEMTGFDIKKVKSYIQNGKRNLKLCMEKNENEK